MINDRSDLPLFLVLSRLREQCHAAQNPASCIRAYKVATICRCGFFLLADTRFDNLRAATECFQRVFVYIHMKRKENIFSVNALCHRQYVCSKAELCITFIIYASVQRFKAIRK